MPRYQFQIVANLTVTADSREQAREAAMMAKGAIPDAVEMEWPAKVKPGRTKLVTVANAKRPG